LALLAQVAVLVQDNYQVAVLRLLLAVLAVVVLQDFHQPQ
jgi:hypothetical protein